MTTNVISWNAFIPKQLLYNSASSFLLTGNIHYDKLVIFVYGLKEKVEDNDKVKKRTITENDHCVGIWQRSNDRTSKAHSCYKNLIVTVDQETHTDALLKLIKAVFVPESNLVAQPVVCIFYDPQELHLSYILSKSLNLEFDSPARSHENVIKSSAIPDRLHNNCSLNDANENSISLLLRNINLRCLSLNSDNDSNKKGININISTVLHFVTCLFLTLPLFLMHLICFFGKTFDLGSKSIHLIFPWLLKIINSSYIFNYIHNRYVHYEKVLKLDRNKPYNRFVLYNCCSQQFLDTCLGFYIIYLITEVGLAEDVAIVTQNWAEDAAIHLTSWMKWFMGAPAGLKLNAQLTRFLGHFFIYHIYLWSGYLSYLRLAMPSIIWYSSLVGVMGISAQLCLVQDVLSMLTVHIYCFYVYAARLFSLQVYVLSSLWRLFFGKKWNVLRSRVDTAFYNSDQLFGGTLIFTVLLFLLPTTSLYYVVFTLLHVSVLIVKGTIQKIVKAVQITPVFSVIIKLFAPKFVAGCVRFEVLNDTKESNTMVLSMETCQISVKKLYSLTSNWMSSPVPPTHSWQEFLHHLVYGQLVYPWIGPIHSK